MGKGPAKKRCLRAAYRAAGAGGLLDWGRRGGAECGCEGGGDEGDECGDGEVEDGHGFALAGREIEPDGG